MECGAVCAALVGTTQTPMSHANIWDMDKQVSTHFPISDDGNVVPDVLVRL